MIYYPSAAGGGMKELFRKVSLSTTSVFLILKLNSVSLSFFLFFPHARSDSVMIWRHY
jgi:hypothetical protein